MFDFGCLFNFEQKPMNISACHLNKAFVVPLLIFLSLQLLWLSSNACGYLGTGLIGISISGVKQIL